MLFFSNIYKLLFISFLCMKLTRILRSTTETFNSYTESSRTHIYNIDDEKVDLETFGLPNEFEEFKRITKRKTSKTNPNLRALFLELKKETLHKL